MADISNNDLLMRWAKTEAGGWSETSTVDSRYSGSLKYGHLDILAIWLGTEC